MSALITRRKAVEDAAKRQAAKKRAEVAASKKLVHRRLLTKGRR